MSDLAIRVENLSKLYPSTALRTGRIGAAQAPYKTLRDTISDFGLQIAALIFVSATQAQSAGLLNNSDLAGDWTSGTP
jgi:hypothetical protein